jgi:hypothetical protein
MQELNEEVEESWTQVLSVGFKTHQHYMKVIWQLPSIIGRGRPQVSLCHYLRYIKQAFV